jgi:hypothetical protein
MILALVAEQLVGPVGLRLEKYRSRVPAKIAILYRKICFRQKFRVREKQKGARILEQKGTALQAATEVIGGKCIK